MKLEEIFKLIERHACEVIPALEGHDFKPNDRLVDLGANSVDRAEIMTMTVEALSLQIPRVELAVASNIGELAHVLYEKLQSV